MTQLNTRPPFATPPTTPGELPGPRTSWPKVLGIIGIVLGILGILWYLWAMVTPFFVGAMLSAGNSDANTKAMADAMEQTAPMQALSGGLQVIAAILLLVAGVGLLQRRGWAPKVAVAWAVVKMVVVLIAAYIGVQVQEAMMDAMAAADPQSARATSIMSGYQGVGAVLHILWGFALPVFMLIWLRRRTIRDEVAAWR